MITSHLGFESLYMVERPALIRLAHLLTGSSAIAEELAQEALLATQQRWEGLDNPAGYARRVLVNLAHSYHRRRRVEKRHPPPPLRHALPPDLDETWEAIRRLDTTQRVVIVLRFYEDLSVTQVAELLGKPEGTIKSLQHRALARLREDLA